MPEFLKNPFGEKNGRLILISDVPVEENGKKCGCICPLCKGEFQAKRNGKIRQPHFAHMGKPCNETVAFMTSLYKFFQQSIEENSTFFPPSVYAILNGIEENQKASLQMVQGCTSFLTSPLNDAEIVLESHPFEVAQCELLFYKEMPRALILTAKKAAKKLAVIVVPPATICKEQQRPQAFENLPTLAIYIDKTVNFYELHSEQLQKKIRSLDFPTEWICNEKLKNLEKEWIKKKWEEHQKKYEEIVEAFQDKKGASNGQSMETHERSSLTAKESRWHICERCHTRKPEEELVFYQNDREDGAICRECSRRKN